LLLLATLARSFPLTADLLARIDAALESDEYRVDFIRNAIKDALARREADRKPPKRGRRS
jgi:hypothetical protein